MVLHNLFFFIDGPRVNVENRFKPPMTDERWQRKQRSMVARSSRVQEVEMKT
jgi:hypothetical protein